MKVFDNVFDGLSGYRIVPDFWVFFNLEQQLIYKGSLCGLSLIATFTMFCKYFLLFLCIVISYFVSVLVKGLNKPKYCHRRIHSLSLTIIKLSHHHGLSVTSKAFHQPSQSVIPSICLIYHQGPSATSWDFHQPSSTTS